MLAPTRHPIPGLPDLLAYPDEREPATFYLLPARPRLARDEAGRPAAQLTLFGRQGARGFEVEGGLVAATVDLAVTAEERARAEAALGAERGQAVRIAPAQWPGGRVEVTLVRGVTLQGRPSLYGDNRCALQARLDAAGAKALEAAWGRGLPEAIAAYELDLPGAVGARRLEVSARLDLRDGRVDEALHAEISRQPSGGPRTLRIEGRLAAGGPLGEAFRQAR